MIKFSTWLNEAAAAPAPPAPKPTAPKPPAARTVTVACPYCGVQGTLPEEYYKNNKVVTCTKCRNKFAAQKGVRIKSAPSGSPPAPSGSPPAPSGSPPAPSGTPPAGGDQRLKDPEYLRIVQGFNNVAQVQQQMLDYFRKATGRPTKDNPNPQITPLHIKAIQQNINGLESYKQQFMQVLQKAQERMSRS